MFSNKFNKEDFYQSKYDFYKNLAFWVVVIASIASITYYVSDCQIIGHIQPQTLLPRLIILIPMTIYILLSRRSASYKIMVPAGYIVSHLIMWTTIWATTFLPDRTHTTEGFAIMLLVFMSIGFCAPFSITSIAYILIIINILVSNLFNHYEELATMLTVLVPGIIGIWILQFFMERLYLTHYDAEKKLKHSSMYDPLTGTYNRNIIPTITDDNQRFVASIPETTGVLILDIDYFKNVNDTYGHVNGDIVLKTVAETTKKLLSNNDYMIRWGGEEFVIVLPGSDAEHTTALAHTIRETIERTETQVTSVTVSIGVSAYNGVNYKESIDNADKALYKAKNSGRNIVIVYDGT